MSTDKVPSQPYADTLAAMRDLLLTPLPENRQPKTFPRSTPFEEARRRAEEKRKPLRA